MVLLLCSNEMDVETELIISWLTRWHISFLKIVSEDLMYGEFLIDEDHFETDGKIYNYNEFKSIFLSRWFFKNPCFYRDDNFSYHSNVEINIMLNDEWLSYSKFFFSKFDRSAWISDPRSYFINKVDQLSLASKVGLNTPQTILTTKLSGQRVNNEWITKPITNMGYLFSEDHSKVFSAYTTSLGQLEKDIDKGSYFPSLIQKKIPFQYEIRCHYVDGALYAAGLIPVSPDQKSDIKQIKYRVSPVKLDKKIEHLIRLFMSEIDMKVGFMDILYDGKTYTFIELNPIGKYAFYSHKCQFNIDHKIASLIRKHYETEKSK